MRKVLRKMSDISAEIACWTLVGAFTCTCVGAFICSAKWVLKLLGVM